MCLSSFYFDVLSGSQAEKKLQTDLNLRYCFFIVTNKLSARKYFPRINFASLIVELVVHMNHSETEALKVLLHFLLEIICSKYQRSNTWQEIRVLPSKEVKTDVFIKY